jgi:uncharacterized protein
VNNPQEPAGNEEQGSGGQPEAEPLPEVEARPRGAESRPGLRGRLPDISWSVKDTFWGLIAGLILAVLVPVVVIPFDPDLESDAGLLVAQGLFGLCLLAVPLGIASNWKTGDIGLAFRRLGLVRFALSALGWMLLALFLYYLFAGFFAELILEPEQDDISDELGVGDESLLVSVSAVLLIVGLAALSEELFFRGFVFSGLRSRMSVWPAAVISGLVFGLVHAPTGITTVVPLAVLGVVLAWLYDRTGSLWPSVIAHALNNALALAILSTDGTLTWL